MIDFISALTNIALFALGAWLLYYFVILQPGRTKKAFSAFAKKHNFIYDPEASPPYNGLLLGTSNHLIAGMPKPGKPIAIFRRYYVKGSGKNRQEYQRTVAAIAIKNTHLHCYINARLNDTSEQIKLAKDQRYTAEGNFGRYFDMYFPDLKRVRSLSIFAPDVLSLIMADYGFNDIEVANDVVYLYDFKYLYKEEELESLYQRAVKLAEAIDNNTPHKITFSSASEAIESHKTVLKQTDNQSTQIALGILFGLLMIYSFLAIATEGQIAGGAWAVFGLAAITILLIIYAIYVVFHQAALRKRYLEERKDFRKDHL